MRRIILHISVSLDGYIATVDGGVEWLGESPNPSKIDYGYGDLYHSIDTVLMGGNTYHELIGYGMGWVYKEKTGYVVSRRDSNVTKEHNVHFITKNIYETISELKTQQGKNIWLVGGGELTTMLLKQGLIDEMQLCIIPTILGKGIPLFRGQPKESQWKLVSNKVYDTGVLVSIYKNA